MSYSEDHDQRISAVRLNSELRHAQLELVSAHCATHQLRLRYSADDLARFGRSDVLRKSAEAASALHEFYSGIRERLVPDASQRELFPQPTLELTHQTIHWMVTYLRQQRDRLLPQSGPLDSEHQDSVRPFFQSELLSRVRIIELHGARLSVPAFVEQIRALGYENLPDIPHMESVTFVDLIAFNESISQRALFHALVHSVQMETLGLDRYAELWIRGFLKARTHYTVPLEVHAFSLASRFLRSPAEHFSVEHEVLHWAAGDRY